MSAVIGNPLLLGPEGYQISRSVRLRSSASAYFNRTPAGAGTSNKTFTYSAWVKRGSLGSIQNLISSPNTGNSDSLRFSAADALEYNWQDTVVGQVTTTQVFRDPSAWYHIMFAMDTTQATASNRFKLYVNGVQVTAFSTANYPAQNTVVNNTAAVATKLGQYANSSTQNFDGYLTEVNFIDGQALTPSSFGENDTVTGVWKPKKYAGTYGTNGFYLNFSDNSNNTAATIGKDYSGNGNNWTPNNISVTSGTTYDSMLDVPTMWADGGNGRGNYAVLNPIYIIPSNTQPTFSNGNLTQTQVGGEGVNACVSVATMPFPTTGKYYCEVTFTTAATSAPFRTRFGVQAQSQINNSLSQNVGTTQCFDYCANGNKGNNNAETAYGSTYTSGDTIGMAIDLDNGKIWWSKNGTWQASGDPAAGTNAAFTGLSGSNNYFTSVGWFATSSINFGQRPFAYTPPSGFNALNTQNLPDSTIKKGNQYFDATTYTGNGSTQTITNSGAMQPDFAWIKSRSNALNSGVMDSVRGPTKLLISNATNAEQTLTDELTSFNSNGFSLGASSNGYTNFNTYTYVAWQWKAGNSSSSNTSGSITSTVSVNATAGFSVVTYTGNSTANATVGHGLGVSPNLVIIKARTAGSVENWPVYHSSLSAGQFLFLNTTNAVQAADGTFNSSTPVSSTVFQFGSPANTRTNSSSYAYVAYCFSAVRGYSAFGSYTGNGSSDGPFVFTGFRPRWLMVKRTDTSGYYWWIVDTARNTYNALENAVYAQASDAETTGWYTDSLANGFKIRNSGLHMNASGGTYIYAAFAENPFKNALAR